MSKARILIVENSIDVTGALKSILRSCEELNDRFEFILILPKESQAIAHVKGKGFQVQEFRMKELRKNWISILQYLPLLLINSWRFRQLIRRLRIDLIVSNDFYNLIPAAYAVCGGKVPYLCYVRFRPSKFHAAIVNVWCWFHSRFATAVIAVSEVVKRELPIGHNVVVIGNEVPAEEVAFAPTTSRTLLYPANYIRGKGQEYALRSFALINGRHPSWRLKFVGSDMGLEKNRAFKQTLKQEAIQLAISDRVEWGSFAQNIGEEYLAAGMVLNFSESESFSLTCVEAMYYGRPIIATNCGGPSEIIDNGETGLLVEVSDIVGMASAIENLIINTEQRQEMGRNAYSRIREKFSYENTVEKLNEAYNSALSNESFNAR